MGVVGTDGNLTTLGPHIGGVVIVIGLVAMMTIIATSLPRLLRRRSMWLLLGGSVAYLVVLFAANYTSFRTLGQSVSVQGRYLLPILPLVMISFAGGLSALIGSSPPRSADVAKVGIVFLIALTLTQGGGILSLGFSAGPTWYHEVPLEPVMETVHDIARMIVVSDATVPDPRL